MGKNNGTSQVRKLNPSIVFKDDSLNALIHPGDRIIATLYVNGIRSLNTELVICYLLIFQS